MQQWRCGLFGEGGKMDIYVRQTKRNGNRPNDYFLTTFLSKTIPLYHFTHSYLSLLLQTSSSHTQIAFRSTRLDSGTHICVCTHTLDSLFSCAH